MPNDKAFQKSEERYHYLVEQASDIILLYDLDTKNLLEGNLAFHRLLGYSIEDIAGLSIYDIVAHDRESIDSNIENTKKKKQCFVGQRKYHKKDGSLLDVEVYVHLFFVEGKGILCSIARDITERKLAEEALSKSEQEKAAILDGLKTVSVEYLDPQMRIVWLNSAVQKHLNHSADEIKGKRCFEVIQGLESPCPGCTALKALQTNESQEGELITPDDKVWISHSNIIKDANGNTAGVVHVAVNITERKRAEKALQESENKYKAIFENTGTAMVIDEDNTIISLANSEFERFTGYSREEMEGKISWTEFVVKEDLERMLEQHKLRRIDPDAALRSYEFRIKDRNGLIKDILLHVDAIPGTKKSVASMLDITDRKQAEDRTIASLREKEVLLKEIHHRVKNNLQIISSLLNIQSRYIRDEVTADVLKECHNRVQSMALIHENLYRYENLARVNFTEYMSNLTRSLSNSFGVDKRRVNLKLDLDEISLSIDKAIPCGLIVNELVSNCLKHAFPLGRSGEVYIELKHYDKDKVSLVVKDNGVGLPDDLEPQESKTLGLKLVADLVKQLKGDLQIDLSSGTEFRIVFASG